MGRVTIFDLEKSIDAAHDEAIHIGKKFNDERHVLKNMNPKLGPEEKATGPGLYSRAFQIRSRPSTDHAKSRGSIGFRTASCTGRTRWAWRTPS